MPEDSSEEGSSMSPAQVNEALRDELSDIISEQELDRLTELQRNSRGVIREKSPPAEETISYPSDLDVVDRVMHVLRSESMHEHQVEWIAKAAAVQKKTCREVLSTLATAGIVIPPDGSQKKGYRLNPYYEFYEKIQRDANRRSVL